MSLVAEIVQNAAEELGISLQPSAPHSFEQYYTILSEWGQNINLTAITGAEDTARLHFMDSLALLKADSFKEARVIDIGSGAGFPGLPLKLAEPSIELTLLDATAKRVDFLTEICERLCLDVKCIHARAEEAALMGEYRESYDAAVSRAVSRMNALCELCLPFVKVGGMFIAMKSVESDCEISEAANAIASLGGELGECFDYTIPGTDIAHRAVVVKKTRNTPYGFPRRFAKIMKSPL